MAYTDNRRLHSWNDYAYHRYGPVGSIRRAQFRARARRWARRRLPLAQRWYAAIRSLLQPAPPPADPRLGWTGHIEDILEGDILLVHIRGQRSYAWQLDPVPPRHGARVMVTGVHHHYLEVIMVP
ncbi:MAG: hypothetical protein D6722_03895 [Bacteroidetes bacterium]|nr:MAG: hypothetical protein D6722_03895 [Bacteroidota bacterium]